MIRRRLAALHHLNPRSAVLLALRMRVGAAQQVCMNAQMHLDPLVRANV